jgi:hypothetical protein
MSRMLSFGRVIDHKDQRYDTVGDWQFRPPSIHELDPKVSEDLQITISDTGDPKMNALIYIHELIEALLCKFHEPEITTEMVDKFDMEHPELDEPGESKEAPYHLQHIIASSIEEALAQIIKVNWEEYEERIKSL